MTGARRRGRLEWILLLTVALVGMSPPLTHAATTATAHGYDRVQQHATRTEARVVAPRSAGVAASTTHRLLVASAGVPSATGLAAEAGGGADLIAGQADNLVSGDLSAAVRALAKHGGRPGSAFPAATGSQAAVSEQAGGIVRDILGNETRRIEFYSPRLKMQVVDIHDATGRGLRYSKQGDFIGFLEPPR